MGNMISRLVKATIVSGQNALAISNTGKAQVNDGACTAAITKKKTISTAEIAAAGVTRLVDSKSILVQAIGGDIRFGHTSGELYHELTKGNFYEFQGAYDIDLYIEAKAGSVDVVISEFK